MSAPEVLQKIDDRCIPAARSEIRLFTGVRNELVRMEGFFDHYRRLGVDRFFIMDNASEDGTREYVLSQPDCHCFHTQGSHFAYNIWPPTWTNALMNVHGDGHWCIAVDADELLVYPECEQYGLRHLCAFLEQEGVDALIAYMLDMYDERPLLEYSYDGKKPFLEATPYFDRTPGWLQPRDGQYPPELMFGGVRERAMWPGRFKRILPPCLTKVPLVRWRKGMRYLVAQHMVSPMRFSRLRGVVLHFKFLTGFEAKSVQSIKENTGLKEKTLEERQAFLEALSANPKLTLKSSHSVRYEDSRQLVSLGWMASTAEYEAFVLTQSGRTQEAA